MVEIMALCSLVLAFMAGLVAGFGVGEKHGRKAALEASDNDT